MGLYETVENRERGYSLLGYSLLGYSLLGYSLLGLNINKKLWCLLFSL